MKVILSRKGFDSGSGGFASPILPCGKLVSLPIPDTESNIKYKDLKLNDTYNYYDIISSLSSKIKLSNHFSDINDNIGCHLDPDLIHGVLERQDGWKGAFGQIRASQTHLENENVCENDIFLFFGWFRRTKYVDEKLVFDKDDKNGKHIIFGYMQIGQIIKVNHETIVPNWLDYHPHCSESRRKHKTNTIYIARETLSWNENIPGYGVFDFDKSLVLTKDGYDRSKWDLPEFLKEVYISYHNDSSWNKEYFQSACRGQEFVIHGNEKVDMWVKTLIDLNHRKFNRI